MGLLVHQGTVGEEAELQACLEGAGEEAEPRACPEEVEAGAELQVHLVVVEGEEGVQAAMGREALGKRSSKVKGA